MRLLSIFNTGSARYLEGADRVGDGSRYDGV